MTSDWMPGQVIVVRGIGIDTKHSSWIEMGIIESMLHSVARHVNLMLVSYSYVAMPSTRHHPPTSALPPRY